MRMRPSKRALREDIRDKRAGPRDNERARGYVLMATWKGWSIGKDENQSIPGFERTVHIKTSNYWHVISIYGHPAT
jgi:hypothetical protein